ncbi:hypothetical protein V6N11_024944 [Hibiscus sabdariffa]|uniref:Uncharacterized protein n=1 Tax=Hibiscus sabdariffa TaxID=183260 RepID=A0ABR2QNX0_9ROSI
MKAVEEIVEFLGEFCGDKVAGVGKGTDLNAHKQAFKKKETLAPEVMEKTITVMAAPVMISLIPCPVILLLNGMGGLGFRNK